MIDPVLILTYGPGREGEGIIDAAPRHRPILRTTGGLTVGA